MSIEIAENPLEDVGGVGHAEELILLPCPVCFRTFKIESLDRHKNVCQKVATKKRKVFDSAKQRLEDLPEVHHPVVPSAASSSTSAIHNKTPTLNRRFNSNSMNNNQWKERHLNLIKTVREARGRTAECHRCPCCERCLICSLSI